MRIKKLGMLTAAVAAVVLMALAAPGGTAFAEKPYTPRTGDPVRKAVMDGLREWVLENHDIKVIFVVNHLLVADGWAWSDGFHGRPGKYASQEADARRAGREGGAENHRNGMWYKE